MGPCVATGVGTESWGAEATEEELGGRSELGGRRSSPDKGRPREEAAETRGASAKRLLSEEVAQQEKWHGFTESLVH